MQYTLGAKINNWTVVSEIFRNELNHKCITLQCSCGNTRNIRPSSEKVSSKCRACYVEEKKKSLAHRAEYKRNYFQENKEKIRKRRQDNPIGKEDSFKYMLKYNYGLSVEEYNNILISQDSKCAICKKDGHLCLNGKLYVDHDHRTNKVRGLLCQKCNSALGLFQDSIEIVLNSVEYLLNNNIIYEEISINTKN